MHSSRSSVQEPSDASACRLRQVEFRTVLLHESSRSYAQQGLVILRPFTVRTAGSLSTHRSATTSHSVPSGAESAAQAPRSSVRELSAWVTVETCVASPASTTPAGISLSTHRYRPSGTHPSPEQAGALMRVQP